MYIPNANAIIQQKLREIENRIPYGLRIQYTTFDKILESQTEKSAENVSNQSNSVANNQNYDDIIEKASATYGVDASLIKAMIHAESDFDPTVTSHKGAQGLMQLMPDTAEQLGVKNAYDPEENIQGGTKFMAWLMDYYKGDVNLALAGYNAGPGNVKKYGGVPPFEETQKYIEKVLAYKAGLKE